MVLANDIYNIVANGSPITFLTNFVTFWTSALVYAIGSWSVNGGPMQRRVTLFCMNALLVFVHAVVSHCWLNIDEVG